MAALVESPVNDTAGHRKGGNKREAPAVAPKEFLGVTRPLVALRGHTEAVKARELVAPEQGPKGALGDPDHRGAAAAIREPRCPERQGVAALKVLRPTLTVPGEAR